jgi:hypothetical protein
VTIPSAAKLARSVAAWQPNALLNPMLKLQQPNVNQKQMLQH